MRNEEINPEWKFEIFGDEMVAENGIRSSAAEQARDTDYGVVEGKYCAGGGEENEEPSVLFAKLQLWLLLIWLYGFGSTTNGAEKFLIWPRVDTWGQKLPLFVSPLYASVLESGQNIENNQS